MLIITAAISGVGEKEYLSEFVKFAKSHKKMVKVYNIGKMLFEQAEKIGVPITPKNVLNANPYVINSLRSAVFENILFSLKKDLEENDAVIINIHAFFFWKKIFTRAYDRFYINQLQPDFFFVFIDDALRIKKRLDSTEQWELEKLTIEEILLWQNIEVEATSSWADINQKKFLVIPAKQPVFSFYNLLFQPEQEPAYISMPITHLKGKKMTERIDRFIKKLSKYFVVFDPRTVEQGPAIVTFKRKKKNLVFYNQIVNRDLYWFIRQSKKIIAFFPKVVSSPGVISELREAHETNKTVWVIHPGGTGSPFISYFCDRVFSSEKEFFAFLKKNYKSRP